MRAEVGPGRACLCSMNRPKPDTSDLAWLKRWGRSNVVCVLGIVAFLLLLRTGSDSTREWRFESQATAADGDSGSADQPLVTAETPSSTVAFRPAATTGVDSLELKPDGTMGPVSVAPTGWRRTANGWENVATWTKPSRPLREIVAMQHEREPQWMRSTLAGVRGLPPLAFAMLQITAIAAIVAIGRRSGGKEANF